MVFLLVHHDEEHFVLCPSLIWLQGRSASCSVISKRWRDLNISCSSDEVRSSFSCHMFNNSAELLCSRSSGGWTCKCVCSNPYKSAVPASFPVLRCIRRWAQRSHYWDGRQILSFLELIRCTFLLSHLILADWTVKGGTVFMVVMYSVQLCGLTLWQMGWCRGHWGIGHSGRHWRTALSVCCMLF